MDSDKERTVSAFEHENALMHYGRVNKRSMIMFITFALTVVILVTVFVLAYTKREQGWKKLISDLQSRPIVVEVQYDGVHQQPSP